MINLLLLCLCVCTHMQHTCAGVEEVQRGCEIACNWSAGCSESLAVGSGNQTLLLCKINMGS